MEELAQQQSVCADTERGRGEAWGGWGQERRCGEGELLLLLGDSGRPQTRPSTEPSDAALHGLLCTAFHRSLATIIMYSPHPTPCPRAAA